MHILTFSTLFPNSIQKVHAVFVRSRMETYVRLYNHKWTVVAPVPYAPGFLGKFSQKYNEFLKIPNYEEPWGYPLYHPRYFLTPKLGMRYYGDWMYHTLKKSIEVIHKKNPIDIIDAHYIFPDGFAAVKIAKDLNIPVVLSARGTDLNLFPQFPAVKEKIKTALNQASHIIHVCNDLKEVALNLGIPSEKMTVIGNGINPDIFKPIPKEEARKGLNLPTDTKIWLSVGHQTERKGFHLIIEAFSRLKDKSCQLILIGNGPQRQELVSLVHHLNLDKRVIFAGAIENKDLRRWYAAADYFALASSREGWPNVLCEAQALGLPIVATKVWGIPEIVFDSSLGILVSQRKSEPLALGMEQAMDTIWDNYEIQKIGQARTWDRVAEKVNSVFGKISVA